MPTFPEELLVSMVGIIMGLLLFAGLLQLGVRVVRLLRLPNELPEGPHFEPPPPPSRAQLDPTEARRIAATQIQLRQRYARAQSAARAAQLCAELAAQEYAAVAGAPDPLSAKRELIGLAARAKIVAENVERAVREGSLSDDDAQVAEAEAAAAQATALAAQFPSGRERRLRLMMVVLVIVVLWTAAMYALTPR